MECTQCTFSLPSNPLSDPFYKKHTRPLIYFCAVILPSAYFIGLWFTLRTHVKQIYHADHKKHDSMALSPRSTAPPQESSTAATSITVDHQAESNASTPSPGDAATATAVRPAADTGHSGGGHDAPEWSKWKSAIILLVSTVLFSLLAELLVDGVDDVISNSGVDQKFLGLTLFALVPNVTEFVNAIAFAMYGNVALSLEIGSAYAVQVALIQIPFLVILSALWNQPDEDISKTFTLVFPQFDIYTTFFSVFLLSYTYIEGKSNYFKGSILTLAYTVMVIAFYFAPTD